MSLLTKGWMWCRSCHKRRYFTSSVAERVRDNASYKGTELRIYPCDDGGFHLTSLLWSE